METSLLLDNKTKQLNLFFKKRFEHSNDVCLKLHGLVSTVTCKAQIEGSLLKVSWMSPYFLPRINSNQSNNTIPPSRRSKKLFLLFCSYFDSYQTHPFYFFSSSVLAQNIVMPMTTFTDLINASASALGQNLLRHLMTSSSLSMQNKRSA
jgi:hypothetical protein